MTETVPENKPQQSGTPTDHPAQIPQDAATDKAQESAEAVVDDQGQSDDADNKVERDMVLAILEAEEFLPIDVKLSGYNRNDVGNAQRLIERFGDNLMFVKDLGWHAWVGTHWSLERGADEARKLAHKTHKLMYKEAAAVLRGGKKDSETDRQHYKRVEALFKWALASGNSNRITNMLNEAATYLTVRLEELDRNKWYFNCLNGTIDLRNNATLIKHDPRHRITKCAAVSYDEFADCSTFDNFINQILPIIDVQTFVQRYFGYALTGITSEQCLMFMYGHGSNGKSTLVDAIKEIMGDYTKSVPFESFAHNDRKRGGDASPDIARLPGSRLVTATEPEQGMRLSESIVKALTGGDSITTRHLNQGFFEFKPEFKLALSGNYKPEIRGQDEGIWRRINLVHFDQHIPKEKRDPLLPEKLRAEYPGILRWMVTGFLCWFEQGGLRPPKEVIEETDEYRRESDPVGQFMDSCTDPWEGHKVQAAELFKAYEKWCVRNAVKPWSATAFGKAVMRRPGIKKEKSGNIYYVGVRLHLDENGDPMERDA